MTAELARECQRVMDERGYLVVDTNRELKPGRVVSDIDAGLLGEIDCPMTVLAETDPADFAEQGKAFGIHAATLPGRRQYRIICE